jgi:hypothetical protein
VFLIALYAALPQGYVALPMEFENVVLILVF